MVDEGILRSFLIVGLLPIPLNTGDISIWYYCQSTGRRHPRRILPQVRTENSEVSNFEQKMIFTVLIFHGKRLISQDFHKKRSKISIFFTSSIASQLNFNTHPIVLANSAEYANHTTVIPQNYSRLGCLMTKVMIPC